ncbi:hypothetical protein JCM11491_003161 [Sporobolomyces phaffii]
MWLARRTFIFEKLKQLGIKSVADLGCGQGSLLSLLSVPAYHVDDFPSLYPPSTPAPASVPSSYVSTTSFPAASHVRPSSPRSQSKDDKLSILRSVPRPDPSHAELHLRKLVGIDADPNVCQIAKRVVVDSTTTHPENRWLIPEFRFEELTSQIFCGNVEVFNASLEDCESLVLTEIIEHLTEAALSKLPNLLFNVYSPRLVVITTPNHAFNPYFPPPDPSTPSSSASEPSTLFPDPTRRTERVFRDPTHLFEFTPDEFETWCRRALADCGSTDEYTLSFTGVGSLAAYYADSGGVPPSPPPSLAFHPALASAYADAYAVPARPDTFYATQVAVFEKKFSHEAERSPRSARPVPLPFFSSSTTDPPSSSGSPLPLSPSNSLASAATGPSSERRATSATGSNGGGRSGIPAAHQLVVSKTYTPRRLARDAEGCGGGGSTRRVLDELEALFEAYADRVEGRSSDAEDEDKQRDRERDEGRIGWMVLSEVWRIGGLPAPGGDRPRRAEDEGSRRRSDATGGESKGEKRPCLRELVEGEIGAIISVLLEEDEWVFELVIDDAGQGETKQGIEALRIGWTGWKGAPDGTDFEEEEEAEGYGADGGENGKVSGSQGTREVDGLTFDGLDDGRTTGDDGAEWDSWERRNADRARLVAPVGNGQNGWSTPDNGGWNDDW